MYIFLDESGNFTKHNHEEYFVIGSFTVGDPHRTAKAFRNWFKTKFPKKMRSRAEVKWSSTGISDDLRLRTLRYISKLDVRIRFVYLLRNNIPSEFRKEDKIKDGLLYTSVVGELLDMYIPTIDPDCRVFCDQRRLSGMTAKDFKNNISARLLPNLPTGAVVQIETLDSASNPNIQIADWISGALARYLEKGKYGEEYYLTLRGNILSEGKELFGAKAIYD